jgi:hypothetical protein
MPNILILYWQPGSGGDFIQSMLLNDSIRYNGVIGQFNWTESGRVTTTVKPQFKKIFDHEPGKWYSREWSINDCDVLLDSIKKQTADTFIIPTHRIDQVWFLKEQFFNSISVGITYPENMFPIVLKNWCKKIAQNDIDIDKIYDQPIHQYLKKHNIFGEFVLKETLRFGSNLRLLVDDRFDIELSLEDLYIANPTMFESLVDDLHLVTLKMQQWLSLQSPIPQFNCPVNLILKNSLGHNSKATKISDLDLRLDLYDNILIKEFCLSHKITTAMPTFKTLNSADCFLNNFKNI